MTIRVSQPGGREPLSLPNMTSTTTTSGCNSAHPPERFARRRGADYVAAPSRSSSVLAASRKDALSSTIGQRSTTLAGYDRRAFGNFVLARLVGRN